MKNELELKLQNEFPFMKRNLKQNRIDSEKNEYERFGFECGSGWYELIRELCSEVDKKYNEYNLPVDIVVLRVKEQFATLRFRYSFADVPSEKVDKLDQKQSLRKEIYEIVGKYEEKSGFICEICGEKGEKRNLAKGYIKTLCDKCFKKSLNVASKFHKEDKKDISDFLD